MNLEKASLKQTCEQEVFPSPGVWVGICEELDRQQISQTLKAWEATPPESTWKNIQTSPQKNLYRVVAAILIVSLFAAFAHRWMNTSPDSSDIQLADRPVIDPKSIQQDVIATSTEVEKKQTEPALQTHVQMYSNKKNNRRGIVLLDDNNYLLVAADNGKPIRISKKWSALSCCLSGESETIECRNQQEAWHTEVACSGLGFQADPILGLMELIDANNDQ